MKLKILDSAFYLGSGIMTNKYAVIFLTDLRLFVLTTFCTIEIWYGIFNSGKPTTELIWFRQTGLMITILLLEW